MTREENIDSEETFYKVFSNYVKKVDGVREYYFPESPMGLWVKFIEGGNFIISGWGSENDNPIKEKSIELPITVLELVKLLFAREDASRIVWRH